MDLLAQLARDRLYSYMYRLTLDEALAQDLLQETILFMIQSLKQLEHADQFWQWLFRTALGKVQHHFRDLKQRKDAEMSETQRLQIHYRVSADINDGLTELIRKEMSDAVFTAMKRLKFKYRNILILRCFENLDYAQIGEVMNCSELQSRVMFFRAKNSLRRQLAVEGFGGRHFLLALALFGFITASAKAATSSYTISAASLEVGFTAGFVATVSSKIGIAATAGIAALAVALPLNTSLYLLGIACLSALSFFLLLCIASIYSS